MCTCNQCTPPFGSTKGKNWIGKLMLKQKFTRMISFSGFFPRGSFGLQGMSGHVVPPSSLTWYGFTTAMGAEEKAGGKGLNGAIRWCFRNLAETPSLQENPYSDSWLIGNPLGPLYVKMRFPPFLLVGYFRGPFFVCFEKIPKPWVFFHPWNATNPWFWSLPWVLSYWDGLFSGANC